MHDKGTQRFVAVTWQNWVAPPAGPVVFDSNFWSHHFIEKSGVFLNARRICYAKITFFSGEMSCTGSGKKIIPPMRPKRYFALKSTFQQKMYFLKNMCLYIAKLDRFEL